MRTSFGHVALVIGLAVVLSGQAPIDGASLKERVDLADFIGVVHIDAVHPTPDASLPMDKRKDWYLQVAEATVVKTIKGHEVPQRLKIKFDNGQPNTHPLYRTGADYLVFLAIEFEVGEFSTAERGQYAIDSAKVLGWSGAADPVPLEGVQEEIGKLVPAAWKSSSLSSGSYRYAGRLGYRAADGALLSVIPDSVLVGWGEDGCRLESQTHEYIAL